MIKSSGKDVDYAAVTEVTGYKVTQEQIQRMYTRYRFASEFCAGREVLEAACGSGQGLGYLAGRARRVVGGDLDGNLVKCAREHYGNRVELHEMDAEKLPFEADSFDVLILYEAIYYLLQPNKFMNEAKRVLRKGGVVLICTANKDWSGFNPSPQSYTYFSAPELSELLTRNGFEHVEIFGDCLVKAETAKDRALSLLKRAAVHFHLMPKTMKGKELLKKLFVGELSPLPPEITDEVCSYYNRPQAMSAAAPSAGYKVLFAVGRSE